MKSNLIAYIGESVYTIVIAVMHQWRIEKFRKGGSATGVQSAPENFWVATPTSRHVNAFMMHVIIVADW